MIKYKTAYYSPYIEKVDVIKETEHFVTIQYTASNGNKYHRREGKITEYSSFFDTWQDAKDYLISCLNSEVNEIKVRLEYVNGKLGKIKGLKSPEEQK